MSFEDSVEPDIRKEFDDDPKIVTLQPGGEHTIIHRHIDSEGLHHMGVVLFNDTERTNSFWFRWFDGDLFIAVSSKENEKT
jgi:hypothetical protein